jgi:tetratricopeptide (TPR) repeat protein
VRSQITLALSLLFLSSLTLFLSSLTTAAFVAPAAAQCEAEPTPADNLRSVARQHYAHGVEASTDGRWEEARDAFQRAYDVAAFAQIVYNLAAAQAHSGQIVEATENYRRFLRRCQSEQLPELREDAQQLLQTLVPHIGHLTIRVNNLADDVDRMTLDGEELAAAVLDTELPVNPGTHTLRVTRQGEELATREFQVAEGESSTVELSVDEYTGPPPPPILPPPGGGDDTGLIVGITVGAVLAVGAAVAIVLAVVLTGQGSGAQLPDGTWEARTLPLVRF